MKLVIDLRDKDYERIKSMYIHNNATAEDFRRIILNGTALSDAKWEEKSVINIEDEPNAITEWQSARCSNCNLYHTTPYSYYFDNYKYCPNCGARMAESEGNA